MTEKLTAEELDAAAFNASMPVHHATGIYGWLRSNGKLASACRYGAYPIGYVQWLIERVEECGRRGLELDCLRAEVEQWKSAYDELSRQTAAEEASIREERRQRPW